jgi:predicted alpha/beta superfamily hydrolase
MYPKLCAPRVGLCFALFLLINPVATVAAQETEATEPVSIGQRFSIKSNVLGETRRISVSLPASYDRDSTKRFPVLYVTDGETQFRMTAGIVDWLSNAADAIPDTIVVAISNTQDPTTRPRDFTATKLANGLGGGAQKFRDFIATELIPYIDEHYRTYPFRMLSGHSMGGLFALDTLLSEPKLFKSYHVASPFLIANQSDTGVLSRLKKDIENLQAQPVTLYASLGDSEANLSTQFQSMTDTISTNPNSKLDWKGVTLEGQSHMTTPAISLYQALQYTFSDLSLSPQSDIVQQGLTAIQAHFKNISEHKYGYEISAESTINNLAISYRQKGDNEKALEVLKANAQSYPDSWRANVSLMQIYAATGQLPSAIEAAQKAQSLAAQQKSPAAEPLKAQIAQLEGMLARSQN